MPDLNDYHAFKNTSGKDGGFGGGKNGGDFGLGWLVIIIVGVMLISFIADGASWDAIETLLGLGFIAFLFAKNLFR